MTNEEVCFLVYFKIKYIITFFFKVNIWTYSGFKNAYKLNIMVLESNFHPYFFYE